MIGAIEAEEVTVEVLEEDVDGPLPPQVHKVASPGESGGWDPLVGEEKDGKHSATGATVTIVIYH